MMALHLFALSFLLSGDQIFATQHHANEPAVETSSDLYDPLNLLDSRELETFDRLRDVGTKHGRVSMLGVVGYLKGVAVRLSDNIARDIDDVSSAGLLQINDFIGFLEVLEPQKATNPFSCTPDFDPFQTDSFICSGMAGALDCEVNNLCFEDDCGRLSIQTPSEMNANTFQTSSETNAIKTCFASDTDGIDVCISLTIHGSGDFGSCEFSIVEQGTTYSSPCTCSLCTTDDLNQGYSIDCPASQSKSKSAGSNPTESQCYDFAGKQAFTETLLGRT